MESAIRMRNLSGPRCIINNTPTALGDALYTINLYGDSQRLVMWTVCVFDTRGFMVSTTDHVPVPSKGPWRSNNLIRQWKTDSRVLCDLDCELSDRLKSDVYAGFVGVDGTYPSCHIKHRSVA